MQFLQTELHELKKFKRISLKYSFGSVSMKAETNGWHSRSGFATTFTPQEM